MVEAHVIIVKHLTNVILSLFVWYLLASTMQYRNDRGIAKSRYGHIPLKADIKRIANPKETSP